MGERIHDAMTSNRLVVTVTNRDSVLRVVASGRTKEERQLVGILAQTDVAEEGKTHRPAG